METYAHRLVEIALSHNSADMLAAAHNNLGRALEFQGGTQAKRGQDGTTFYQEAVKEYGLALSLQDQICDPQLRNGVRIRSNAAKGDVHDELGQFDLAEQHWKQSIEAAVEAGNSSFVPIPLKNLANCYMKRMTLAEQQNRMAEYSERKKSMADYFSRYRATFHRERMLECVAWCDRYLAVTQDPQEATRTLQTAIEAVQAFDPKQESEVRASLLHYLGLLYNNIGDFEEAEAVCEKADQVWAKRFPGNEAVIAEYQAECRNNWARALLNLGEFQAAHDVFAQALSLKKFCPKFAEWSVIETNKRLADQCLHFNIVDITPEAARRIVAAPGDVLVRAAIALRMAEEFRGTSPPNQGEEVLQIAQGALEKEIAASRAQSASPAIGLQRLFLGALVLERKLPQQAASILEQARKELEETHNESGLTFCLPLLAVVQAHTGQAQKAEETFNQALQRFEVRLARITAPERMGLFQFAQANTLYADYADFLAHSNRQEEAILMADRGRARGLARQALKVLAASHASDSERQERERFWLEPLTSQGLRELTQAHPDTLFLHYSVGSGSVILLALGNKVPGQCFRLKRNYPVLMRQVSAWMKNLSLGGLKSEEESLARDLGESLLEPLYTSGLLAANNKGGRWHRLVIVPDGGLHSLPFAALILPEPGTHRLIERLPYSITLSLRQLSRRIPLRKSKNGMLIVSDPTGDSQKTKSKQRMALQGSSLDPPLTVARDAAREMKKQFAGNAMLLLGKQADKEAVLRLLSDYPLLVFATHGHPSEERNGLASYLTLAPEKGGVVAGRLEASEILTQQLSAHLAMLIACKTAQGRFSGGEGIQGLVWAFWAAGCPDVVASLWEVNSRSMSMLLPLFLKEQQKFPPDIALQKAVLKVRSQYPDAGDWAAFQNYGNP